MLESPALQIFHYYYYDFYCYIRVRLWLLLQSLNGALKEGTFVLVPEQRACRSLHVIDKHQKRDARFWQETLEL